MNVNGLFSIKAPPEADQAAYQQRIAEVGFAEASFWFVKQHFPVACPVVDLDEWRKEKT